MTETVTAPVDAQAEAADASAYAALDLGTNNCRLLIATPHARGFRIVDAFSRIVRLGEGSSQTGRLSEPAMERAIGALRICADKIRRRGVVRVRAVATQACRGAANGAEFVATVAERTGLRLEVITPREEAQLSVAGCLDLLDRQSKAALVLDVAHNPHSVAALAENLDAMGFYPCTHAVFGAMADKDLAPMLARLDPLVDKWYFTDLPTPRAAIGADLESRWQAVQKRSDVTSATFESPRQALDAAVAASKPADRIVVFGSFYTVGGVLKDGLPRLTAQHMAG